MLHEPFWQRQALRRAGTHPLGAHNDATGKGVASLSQDLEKIISLNYRQWDDTLIHRGFYDSEDSIGCGHRRLCRLYI
jgi:hypothetical protein